MSDSSKVSAQTARPGVNSAYPGAPAASDDRTIVSGSRTSLPDDGPEEFQVLLYCYHCCRRLNDEADQSTVEVAPQICSRCGP